MARHSRGDRTPNYILWGIVILIALFVGILCYIYGTQGVLDWFLESIDTVEKTNQN